MPAHRTAIALGLLGGAAAAFGACLLPEITVAEETETLPDAGPDTGPDAEPDAPPAGCVRATYPPPPGGSDAVSVPDIVVAMHIIDMGEVSPEPPGFDLDFTCTCFEEAGDSCSTKLSKPRCDGPGGVDNAASKLFKLVTDNLGEAYFGSDFYSSRADLGLWSVLFRISGYNGSPNDPNVTVALFVSSGTSGVTPLWDGTDKWSVSSDSLGPKGDVTDPLYLSDGGYVNDGVLVATLPSVALRLSGSEDTISVHLAGGVVSGQLVFDDLGAHITKGVIAARWSEKEVFASLASFRGPMGTMLCNDGGFVYNSVRANVCSNRDILSDSIQAAATPCDALSLGIGFEADPAMLGDVKMAADPAGACPEGQSPAEDSCAP